jgi:hypothetical protein
MTGMKFSTASCLHHLVGSKLSIRPRWNNHVLRSVQTVEFGGGLQMRRRHAKVASLVITGKIFDPSRSPQGLPTAVTAFDLGLYTNNARSCIGHFTCPYPNPWTEESV